MGLIPKNIFWLRRKQYREFVIQNNPIRAGVSILADQATANYKSSFGMIFDK
jgi:hypothetical protein